jgi:hypothetical protein
MFSLQYEITNEDYLDADMAWYSRPWFKWIIIRGLPAFLIVSSITLTLFFDKAFGEETEFNKLYFRFLLGAAFFISIIFFTVMKPNALAKNLEKRVNKSIDQDLTLVGRRQTLIDELGILVSKEKQTIKIQVLWNDICNIQETDNLFIFCFLDYKRTKQRTFIPKRAFESNNQLADFRNALVLFKCSPAFISAGN